MKRRRHYGFTLVELLVAMGVSAVLIGAAIPSFKGLAAKRQVESAAQAYVAALNEARSAALARNRNVEIIFTTSTPIPSAVVTAIARTTATAKRWLVRERAADSEHAFVAGFSLDEKIPGVTMSATAKSVGFTPMGRAVNFSTGTRLPLASDHVVIFEHAGASRKYCAFLTTGGTAGVCDPAADSGSQIACAPRITASSCQ